MGNKEQDDNLAGEVHDDFVFLNAHLDAKCFINYFENYGVWVTVCVSLSLHSRYHCYSIVWLCFNIAKAECDSFAFVFGFSES